MRKDVFFGVMGVITALLLGYLAVAWIMLDMNWIAKVTFAGDRFGVLAGTIMLGLGGWTVLFCSSERNFRR